MDCSPVCDCTCQDPRNSNVPLELVGIIGGPSFCCWISVAVAVYVLIRRRVGNWYGSVPSKVQHQRVPRRAASVASRRERRQLPVPQADDEMDDVGVAYGPKCTYGMQSSYVRCSF